MEITERVKSLADKYLKDNNIELIDIIYRREQGGMVLRLLVDTAEGITLDDCVKLNNYLSEEMDKENFIEDPYTIEVSSPGLDRPLVSEMDFKRAIGRTLEIVINEAIDMRKNHTGKLVGSDGEKIVIESGGISTSIPRSSILSAKFKVEFIRGE